MASPQMGSPRLQQLCTAAVQARNVLRGMREGMETCMMQDSRHESRGVRIELCASSYAQIARILTRQCARAAPAQS
jgi:hypothetical protein